MPAPTEIQKPTLGGLLREATREFSGFDRGLPYTVRSLLTAPGATVRRYLEGHDARITRPLRLFLATLVLYFAAASVGGVDEMNARGLEQSLATFGVRGSDFTTFFSRYQTALFALVLPLMMFATRASWPRAGRTLAEHLILNTYLFAAQLVIMTALMPLRFMVEWAGVEAQTALSLHSIAGGVLSIGYAAWMMATFFAGSRLWSAIRAIAIQLGMMLVYWIVVLAVFLALAKAGVG
jgi:Protein of unknown function (DUF3667)